MVAAAAVVNLMHDTRLSARKCEWICADVQLDSTALIIGNFKQYVRTLWDVTRHHFSQDD